VSKFDALKIPFVDTKNNAGSYSAGNFHASRTLLPSASLQKEEEKRQAHTTVVVLQ
jgi:hypothetical protein